MVSPENQNLLVAPLRLGQRLMGICGFREVDRRGGVCWWFCFGLGEVSKGNLLAWLVGFRRPAASSHPQRLQQHDFAKHLTSKGEVRHAFSPRHGRLDKDRAV